MLYASSDSEPRVWRVTLEGNRAYNDIILREVVANSSVPYSQRIAFWRTRGELYSEAEARRDVVRLTRFYQRRGFPDVLVTFETKELKKPWRREVIFKIDEGEPIIINSQEFTFIGEEFDEDYFQSDRGFRRAKNRNPLRAGVRYEHIRNGDAEVMILDALKNMGFAFSKVQIKADVDSAAYAADIKVTVDSGPLTYFGNLSVEGNVSVTEELVVKESGLKQGDLYSQRKLTRAQQEIFGHHLFRFVTISTPEQERDSTIDLTIRVRENPLRSVTAHIGAGTEEIVRTGASWVHRNPFGNAHSFSIAARASFIEQRLNVDYTIPYVFNTNSSYIVSPFAQRLDERNFLLLRYGAVNSFVYRYSQNLAGTITYEFTINEERLKGANVVIQDSTQFYNQSAIKISGFYNTAFMERGKGWSIRPFIEISGFFNTGTLKYERASIDLRRYIDFSQSTQLAIRIESGVLFARDTDRLPSNVLYYLGGSNSVRGWSRWDLGPKRALFDENDEFFGYTPTGGRVNLAFNTEFRQDLNALFNGFGVAFFLDGGQIWRNRSDVALPDLQFGAGAGLRYRSPVGPVRLDVGYKINPNDTDLNIFNGIDKGGRLARFGIHFSIGQSF